MTVQTFRASAAESETPASVNLVDATAAPETLNLPLATDMPTKALVTVVKTDASANAVTVQDATPTTIATLEAQGDVVQLFCDRATWTVINATSATDVSTHAALTAAHGASGAVMGTGNVQTVTGAKTFGSPGAVGKLKIAGTTSGAVTVDVPAVAGTNTVTLPAATDQLVGRATTDDLTNKTYNKVTITPPATSATLTIPDGVVFTGPPATGTAATLAGTEALTGKTYNKITLTQPANGATLTIPDGVVFTGPSVSGTAATLAGSEALTNKAMGAGTSFSASPTGYGVPQWVTVNLSSAALKAARATAVQLVAAPAAGEVLEFLGGMLLLDFGTVGYAEDVGGSNFAVKYTDGTGLQVSTTIEATGFIDAVADSVTNIVPIKDTIALASASVAKALVLHNVGAGEIITGDSVIRAKIAYRVWKTDF